MASPATQPRGRAPWFREQPLWTLTVAGVLFVAVFTLRLTVGDATDAVNLLYALPVSLVALAFGRNAGSAAGFAGVALVSGWALLTSADLSVLGWTSRVVPLLLLGYLLGDASDRLEEADRLERAYAEAAQRHRDATEVNDTLVQGMSAAKWSLEAGRHDTALKTLEETLALGHELVSKLMRDADMGIDGHRPPDRR